MEKRKKKINKFLSFVFAFVFCFAFVIVPFLKPNESASAASSSGSSKYYSSDDNCAIVSYLPCSYTQNWHLPLQTANFSNVLGVKSSDTSGSTYVSFSCTFKYSFDDYYNSISLNANEKYRVEQILKQYYSYFETAPILRTLVVPLYLYQSPIYFNRFINNWDNSLIEVTCGSFNVRITNLTNDYPFISYLNNTASSPYVVAFFNIGLYCGVNNVSLYDAINNLQVYMSGALDGSTISNNYYYTPCLIGVQSGAITDSFGASVPNNRSYENLLAFNRFRSLLYFDDLRFDIDDESANYNAGYITGKNDAILQNQSDVESARQMGYNNGYDAGEQVGYQNGYTAGSGAGANLGNVIFSFASLPTGILSNMFNFNLFGFNIYAVLLAIITLLVGIWIIKKVK